MINAGQLNRRVEICELTDGINPETGRDAGQKYVPVCNVDVYNQIQKKSDRGPLYKIRWDIL